MKRIWARYRGLKTKWQVVIAATLVVIGISAAASPSEDAKSTVKTEAAASSSPTTEKAAQPTTTAAPAPTTTVAPTTTTTAPPAPRESVAQENAREKADSYLGFTSFSRKGLIDQLKFDGFNEPDATYGVDSLGTDWNDQAAKKAASYLEFTSFSHSSLVDQLVFDGFSPQQAEYGVGTTGL